MKREKLKRRRKEARRASREIAAMTEPAPPPPVWTFHPPGTLKPYADRWARRHVVQLDDWSPAPRWTTNFAWRLSMLEIPWAVLKEVWRREAHTAPSCRRCGGPILTVSFASHCGSRFTRACLDCEASTHVRSNDDAVETWARAVLTGVYAPLAVYPRRATSYIRARPPRAYGADTPLPRWAQDELELMSIRLLRARVAAAQREALRRGDFVSP
jgi:hypothetical protein